MKNLLPRTAGLFLVVLVVSCQQPATSTGTQTQVLDSAAFSIALSNGSVYVGGEFWTGTQWESCYWVDGQLVDTYGTAALSISVSKGTVYAGGQAGGIPCYWVSTSLYTLDGASYADGITGEVRSIDASGASVKSVGIDHAAVNQHTYYPWEATIWTQTSPSGLSPTVPGAANSICDYAGTYYVAGQFFDGTNSVWLPYVWNSANQTTTTLPGGLGTAYSIYVDGSGIYACGQIFDGKWWKPCYWTNTTMTRLAGTGNQNASANSVTVDSGTVYTAGDWYDGTNWNPCYWAGTARTDLPGSSPDTFVSSGAGINGTVYCAGYYYDGSKYVACYWAGANRNDLPGITVTTTKGAKGLSVARPKPFNGESAGFHDGGAGGSRRAR